MYEVTYAIRFFCEWGAGCLWPGNDATYRDFGLGPYDVLDRCPLPLVAETVTRCRALDEWHGTSLNRDYSLDPGPWRQQECDQFNATVAGLVAAVQAELGPQFRVVNQQAALTEDPDLDAYLADSKSFRRPNRSAAEPAAEPDPAA